MAVLHDKDLLLVQRKLQSQIADLDRAIGGPGGISQLLASQQQTINGLLSAQAQTPPSPVANLLFNGECGHSQHTWNDATDPTPQADKNCECAWWYSHQTPAEAKTFTSANVDTGADTVTIVDHGFTTGGTVDLLAEAGGTLPAPLTVLTTYYLIVLDADTLQFATTVINAEAGTPINLTTTGTAAKTYTIQQLLIATYTTAAAGSNINNELKTTAHTQFDPRYSNWDSVNGQADLTGTTTLDALMPVNNVDATLPLARVSLIAARKNRYIEIPEEALMAAGIWDNTSGQRTFLTGDVGFEAQTQGTPGTTNRNFRILLSSDRGFSILSDEIVLINTPADGAFSSTSNIGMSWKQQAGQLQVDIYEHYDPGGPGDEYRLITEVSSGTGFIYEGDFLQVVSGYPTATGDVRSAVFYTQTADMSDLAINNVALTWDTVNFPIGVPDNYNKANTTDRQWVRIWMTVAANIFADNCTIYGNTHVIFPAAILAAIYATQFETLAVYIYDSDGVFIDTSSIDTWTSTTEVNLNNSFTNGTGYKIRIVGGGFGGILLDKIHLGYQQNTSYAPNALDTRILQPLAAPSSSGQGGAGGGGSGGGINCVAGDTPIKMYDGAWKAIETTRPGNLWASAGFQQNILVKLSPGFENVRRVRSANGCEVVCTDTEQFMIERPDTGTPLYRLRVGDRVWTEVNDRLEASTISEISPYLGKTQVFTPALSDNHLFIAGEMRFTLWQRLWNRWMTRWFKGYGNSGFVLHNRKIVDPP